MIAQQPVPPPPPGAATSIDVLILVGAMIVAVMVLGIVILLIRRKLLVKDSDAASDWLVELRRLHKAGEMSTQEYDAARKALTTRIANGLPAPKPSKPAPPHPPARALPDARLVAKPGFDLTGAPLPPRQSRRENPYDRKPPPTGA